jgi:hypothetical protein
MKIPRKQGIVHDERGQTQPADRQRAQQSQMEGPAAYTPSAILRRSRGGLVKIADRLLT